MGFGLIDLILRLNLNRPEPLYGYELGNTFDYVVLRLVHVILGVSLIFGADFLTACAYPGSRTGHVNQFDEQVPNSPAQRRTELTVTFFWCRVIWVEYDQKDRTTISDRSGSRIGYHERIRTPSITRETLAR
jgi:hypothetical protein